MNLEQFSINKHFARSARIDSEQSLDVIENYVFHDTAKTTFLHLLQSYQNNQVAFTITGPYGSGKSSLAIILDKLLTADENVRKLCAEKISKGQKSLFSKALPNLDQQWLSIKIVGKRSNCVDEIARAIDDAVASSDLKIPKKLKSETPASTAEVVNKLKLLSTFLSDNGSGLLIIIDEMGKYLEFAAQSDGDIFIFQEIAEVFADLKKNKEHDVLFINILHQSFEDYATRNQDTALQVEWAKIQGRFENILFNLGFEQGVDLISGALKGRLPKPKDDKFAKNSKDLVTQISKGRFKTRDDLNLSLELCHPLNPLTTLLLGPIAKEKFGQNERSLFTFLSSSEPHGFSNFIKNEYARDLKDEYGCDDLWDYLELNYESTIIGSPMSHAWEEVKECIRRADQLGNPHVTALTKLLALIELFGRKHGITASKKLLSAAVNLKLKYSLQVLEEKSIVIFRKSQDEYRLFEGSDIDINSEVEVQKAQINYDWDIILKEIPTPIPIVPKRHYLETGALRWFERRIVSVSYFENNPSMKLMDNITGLFLLFLPDAQDTYKTFAKKISQLRKTSNHPDYEILYGISDFNLGQSIVDCSLEIAALRRALVFNEAIKNDKVARNEFNARLSLSEKRLNERLNIAFDNAEWQHKDKKLPQQPLSVLSSKISDSIYKLSPVISNELINRDIPSTIAVSGRAKLILQMFNSSDKENLGIEGGLPPEMSFYLNILKKEKLHQQKMGEWMFTKPDPSSTLNDLYQSMDEYLKDMNRCSIAEIYNKWSLPPYGVKKGVMPILMMAFYLSRVDEFAIYEEDTFRPTIDETFIEKFMFSPELVFIQKIDLGKSQQYLITAMRNFTNNQFNLQIKSESVLDICKPLVSAAYHLHPYVRRTRSFDKVDKNAQSLRQALVSTKNPYDLLFSELPRICLGQPFDLNQTIDQKKIDQFISVLSQLWSQLDEAYDKMIQSMKSGIITLFGYEQTQPSLKKIQTRANKLLNYEGITNTFASRLLEGSNDQETTEKVLTYISEKPLDGWTDQDFSNTKLRLVDRVNEFKRMERLVATYNKSDKKSTFKEFKDSYLVDILISEDHDSKSLTRILDITPEQQKRIKTVAINSLDKLPKDMTKDEKVAMAIEILKLIEHDEKEQLSLFKEVSAE